MAATSAGVANLSSGRALMVSHTKVPYWRIGKAALDPMLKHHLEHVMRMPSRWCSLRTLFTFDNTPGCSMNAMSTVTYMRGCRQIFVQTVRTLSDNTNTEYSGWKKGALSRRRACTRLVVSIVVFFELHKCIGQNPPFLIRDVLEVDDFPADSSLPCLQLLPRDGKNFGGSCPTDVGAHGVPRQVSVHPRRQAKPRSQTAAP